MRRTRFQQGSVKKQDGRWVGMWREDGGRKSRVLGLVKDMTKSEARNRVAKITTALLEKENADRAWLFGEFVREIYIPFYSRKWKASTRLTNENRVMLHLVGELGLQPLAFIKRDEIQAVLDRKATGGLSFSIIQHLRWDANQIFDMAVAEGLIVRNPATLIWTPRDAKRAARRVMTAEQAQLCFDTLAPRERLITKLAVIAGMRPGEIFALTWGTLTPMPILGRGSTGASSTPRRLISRYAGRRSPKGCLARLSCGERRPLRLRTMRGCSHLRT